MAKVENSTLELQNDLEELKDGEKHRKKIEGLSTEPTTLWRRMKASHKKIGIYNVSTYTK